MQQMEALKKALDREKVPYLCNEPMSLHTTFKIGGPAGVFIRPGSEAQAAAALRCCRGTGTPYFVLGRGSNLLVGDEGPKAAILQIGEGMSDVSLGGDTILEAQCGIPLTRLCRFAQEQSLTGLEFAYGIPGYLGGGLYMNAGAYGGELRDVVRRVRWLDEDGILREASGEELGFGYRRSYFTGRDCCILSARLALEKGDPSAIGACMEELMNRRREKQPLEYGSAGSTFKRPEGAYASALIDQCGLKGLRVGDAQVSEKHAGFVINRGSATCAQVQELIRRVQAVVKEKTGFELECEIREL